jgi:hypothetical protein
LNNATLKDKSGSKTMKNKQGVEEELETLQNNQEIE